MWYIGGERSLTFMVLFAGSTVAAPSGFPTSGNGLWYNSTGSIWSRHSLPVGNGFLAATTFGGTIQETTQLNIESLWSGGPFADPSYNGGNKQPDEQSAMVEAMQEYRQTIFEASNGTITNVDKLSTNITDYGSYAGAGFLSSTLLHAADMVANAGRYLDMDAGKTVASWTLNGSSFSRETFCSFSAEFCIQNTSTTSLSGFSQVYALVAESNLPPPNVSCIGNDTLILSGMVADPGMAYEIMAKAVASNGSTVSCMNSPNFNDSSLGNATITVTDATSAYVVWVGGTNYDINAGDAAHNYSFEKQDPHDGLTAVLSSIVQSGMAYGELLASHTSAFRDVLYSNFSLDLGQEADLNSPTDVLKEAYTADTGNPYLEWVLFNFGRYLLASSARGTLPANLQGKWALFDSNPWSADYHSNINLQMNYWSAEMTNLELMTSLFDYINKTWAPRGAYTAQVLYNMSQGWVTHDEMNIFGYTGMKAGTDSAQWADYPESNAWMMIHVWDHFDFTNDVAWWKSQGYPLLKGVAQFHLQKLIPDEHFNDGTLVVSPCNSPEQAPVTLGCAHAQQLIWQLFNAIEKGAGAAGDNDEEFLNQIRQRKAQMDKGIHIGSWGQLQEWKVDMDKQNDTHRHLSHLIGLYPGYALSSFNATLQSPNLTLSSVLDAAKTSLIHRGNGTGPDADAGWEKVWRAACWAQLGDSEMFYQELSYAVERNFAENLWSVYNPGVVEAIFQIDANLGFPGAVMNALVQAPDVADLSIPLTVTLLPALPSTWPTGSVKGARIRGGMSVDLSWADREPTRVVIRMDAGFPKRKVKVVYKGFKVGEADVMGSAGEVTISKF